MAQSTGGFWSSTGGQALSGIGAALGLGPLFDTAISREVNANENDLSRQHDEYMARVQQLNAIKQMQFQQDFEKNMSSTAYQRAVADMEAAGINPASLAGSSALQASTPGSSTPGASAGHSNAIGVANGGSNSPLSSMMSSAFNAILSKDKAAAEIAKSELVDNARHAHAMEESREARDLAMSKSLYYQALYQKINDENFLNKHR